MKKLAFIFFVFCFLQPINAQRFEGGFLGGISLAQIDGDWQSGYNNIGLNAGMFVRTNLGEYTRAQLEIKYNKKGAANWGNLVNPSSYIVSLHYVDIPVMVQLSILDKIFPELGISAGYLMGARYYDNAGLNPYSPKQYYSVWDFNYFLGLSYYFTEKLGANVRWGYSIVPIYETATGVYQGRIAEILGLKDGYYNNYLNFSVYYTIDFNK